MKRKRIPLLEDVWRLIPSSNCKGLCQASCGPIGMSVEEDQRLEARGVHVPTWREAIADLDHYECPAMVDGACSVYDDRPTICRLWGSAEEMPCPHGCLPDGGLLSPTKSRELLDRSNRAGGGVATRYFE